MFYNELFDKTKLTAKLSIKIYWSKKKLTRKLPIKTSRKKQIRQKHFVRIRKKLFHKIFSTENI